MTTKTKVLVDLIAAGVLGFGLNQTAHVALAMAFALAHIAGFVGTLCALGFNPNPPSGGLKRGVEVQIRNEALRHAAR